MWNRAYKSDRYAVINRHLNDRTHGKSQKSADLMILGERALAVSDPKEPATMRPTKCRNVHYHAPQLANGLIDTYAAIVTNVHEDGTVDLVTFGSNSMYFQHKVPHAELPTPGHWSWPPRG